jgi:hypothetical protein
MPPVRTFVLACFVLLSLLAPYVSGDEPKPFDARRWNVSSGNASTFFIRASPIGAGPANDFKEAPPDAAWLQKMHAAGMVAFEDYIAWGAVERTRGEWNWTQHDRMEEAMHAAGLKYVVYTWLHFPPTWLRDEAKGDRTLMRCLAHGQEANYLSVFDPHTIEWYDHFYKALKEHFGDRIDDVYACILGPYGEGNYPLYVPDWVNMGHCHEGWWAGDECAIRAFQAAMKAKYAGDIAALNRSWGTSLKDFADVKPPAELSNEKFKPSPAAFPKPEDKRRWLDFITWYHQAIIDFSEKSVQTVLKYFPKEKVRLKPGGTSHGVNPITYGTYSPGYAKMAGKYPGIVLQPGDCDGAVFADKWLGTAYQFYGVKLGTEPASQLDHARFVQRMFSEASAGASQLFTYEIDRHLPDIQQYISLYTGKSGDTSVALFCPTTFHRLGGDAGPTVMAGDRLRDLCEYDVLDELLILDDALANQRYKALVVVQADVVDQPVLDKIEAFTRAGGRVITLGRLPFRNVEGQASPVGNAAKQITGLRPDNQWLRDLAAELKGLEGVDGELDGLWTCRRGQQIFVFNATTKPKRTTVAGAALEIAPHPIWVKPAEPPR